MFNNVRSRKETTMSILLEKAPFKKDLSEPFRWFDSMRDELERLLETNGFKRTFAPRTGNYWMPALEIFEKGGEFRVNAELPGLKKEDITLEATPEGLTLTGLRKLEKSDTGEGYYRSERAYGEFRRFVPIPDGANLEKLTAEFKDGMLKIVIPVPQPPQALKRVIEIK
jgi:HSP20 family protein